MSNEKGRKGRKGIASLTSNHCMLLRAKRPNKPNRHCYITHCSLHLMPQALQIKCPSVGVRTMSTARDSRGWTAEAECRMRKARKGRKGIAPLTSNHCMLLRAKRANKPNRHCSIKLCTLHIKCPTIVLGCLRCHGVGSGTLESLGNREDAEKDFSLNVWWSRDFVVTLQTNFDVL